MFINKQHIHNQKCLPVRTFLVVILLLFGLSTTGQLYAAQKPSGSVSPGMFWFPLWRPTPSQDIKAVKPATLGHGQGLGAEKITNLIFPGTKLESSSEEEKHVIATMAKYNFSVEKVTTSSAAQGLEYTGYLATSNKPKSKNRNILVWLHGNAQQAINVIKDMPVFLHLIAHPNHTDWDLAPLAPEDILHKWDILAIEYPGFADTPGRPKPLILENMVKQWQKWLPENRYNSQNTVICGQSIGTAVAAYWASQSQPAGLILDSPYPSIGDIAATHFPYPLVSSCLRLLFRDTLETSSFVHQIHTPTLVITRGQDRVIPEELGIRQYEAIKETNTESTTHISLSSTDHNNFHFISDRVIYFKEISAFLGSVAH